MDESDNLLELAKQGDVKAIETLLNCHLQSKGIIAKTVLKDGCLQVTLESKQLPHQANLVTFLCKKITSLGVESIKNVKIQGKHTDKDNPAWLQEIKLSQENKTLKSQQVSTIKTSNLKAIEINKKSYAFIKKNKYFILSFVLLIAVSSSVIAKTKYSSLKTEDTALAKQTNIEIDLRPEKQILEELRKLNQYVELEQVKKNEYLEKLAEFENKGEEYLRVRNINSSDKSTQFQIHLSAAIQAHTLAISILGYCSEPEREAECEDSMTKAANKYADLRAENPMFESSDIAAWTKFLWHQAKENTEKAQSILDLSPLSIISSNSIPTSTSTYPTEKAYPLTQCGLLLTAIGSQKDNRVLFQKGKYRESAWTIQVDLAFIESLGKPISQESLLYSYWNQLVLDLRVRRSKTQELAFEQSNVQEIPQSQLDEIDELIESEAQTIRKIRNVCE